MPTLWDVLSVSDVTNRTTRTPPHLHFLLQKLVTDSPAGPVGAGGRDVGHAAPRGVPRLGPGSCRLRVALTVERTAGIPAGFVLDLTRTRLSGLPCRQLVTRAAADAIPSSTGGK
jgi:hypothetical protein